MNDRTIKIKAAIYSYCRYRIFRQFAAIGVLLYVPFAGRATDINFLATDTKGSVLWSDVSKWEGGVAPGEGDNAVLKTIIKATNTENDNKVLATVELPKETTAVERGNLTGYGHFVLLGADSSGCKYSFRSLDGYLGTVKLRADNVFQIRAEEEQSFGGVEVAGNNTLDVKGGAVRLGKLCGTGKLVKRGAGELSLSGVTGALGVSLDVAEGNVNIAGGDLAVLNEAALHIDATKAETFSFDGNRITQVRDVRGDGYPTLGNNIGSAKLVDFGDKKLIDFGGYSGNEGSIAVYGDAASLICTEEIAGIKTFFIVYRYNKDGGGWDAFPLADSMGYIFRTAHDKDKFEDNVKQLFTYQQYNGAWQMWAPHSVVSGDIRRNGECVSYNKTPRGYGRNLEVFSLSVNENSLQSGAIPNVAFQYLCRNQNEGKTGGSQVGEVILFTRKLSDVEQKAVSDYLVGKWMTESGVEPFVVQSVGTRKGASVTVPEGATVRVKVIDTTKGAFVKKGKGTLIAKNVIGSGLIVAEEGNVLFGKGTGRKQLREPVPAVGLWAAFDANKSETLIEGEHNGVQGVLGWKSHSVNNVGEFSSVSFNITNKSHTSYNDRLPQKITDEAGRVWLDFGVYSKASSMSDATPESSHMQITRTDGSDVGKNSFYEAFFVIERNNEGATPAILSSGNNQWWRYWRGGGKSIVDLNDSDTGNTAWWNSAYAQYAINGAVIDATSSTYPQGPCVVRVSCANKTYIGALGNDNGYFRGGFKIGEILFYSRQLTDKERTETEAYLMKKWLGAEHADATERDNSESSVAFGGEGGIALSGGMSLAISQWRNTDEAAPAVLTSEAVLMHLDMSDYSKLEFTTASDGTPKVDRIWDTRGTTRSAAIPTDRPCPNLPGIAMNKVTNMPMLDLGTLRAGTASALFWCDKNESGVIEKKSIDFKSYVMVYANIEDDYYADTISSNWGDRPYESGDDQALWSSNAQSPQARGGADFIDGEKVDGSTTPYPHGLHVFGHTNGGVWGYGSNGTGLKKASGEVGGGMYIAEIIYFNRGLSSSEQVEIGKYLAKKWGIAGSGLKSPALSSISLSEGAKFESKSPVEVAAISGYGAITAPSVGKISRIEASVAQDGTGRFIRIEGEVKLEQSGTYALRFADGFKVVNGFYTLLQTGSTGLAKNAKAMMKAWQMEIAPVDGKTLRLGTQDDCVGIIVSPCKFMVIMR